EVILHRVGKHAEHHKVAGVGAGGPRTFEEQVGVGSTGDARVGRADVALEDVGADKGRGADSAGAAVIRLVGGGGVLSYRVGARRDGTAVEVVLFEVGQKVEEDPTPATTGGRHASGEPALCRRQTSGIVVAVVRRQAELLHVVGALDAVGRLAHLL